MNQKTEPDVLTTKSRIIESTVKLMSKNNISDITIKEIAWETGISRRTFYSYFSSKEQLLRTHMIELINNFKDDFNNGCASDLRSFLLLFCKFWHENIRFFRAVFGNPEIDKILVFEDFFYLLFAGQRKNSAEANAFETVQLNNFINGGLIYMLVKWLTSKSPESPERMAEQMYSFISSLPGTHENVKL